MSSDLDRSLRRLRTEKKQERLRPRKESDLPFLDSLGQRPKSLLYDTTVYVDVLQGRFPLSGEVVLRASDAWHSTVAESELAALCGVLDPKHPGTHTVIDEIKSLIARVPSHRTLAPDRKIWLEAGILAGMFARLRGIVKNERRRILSDALIFTTARWYGHTVLTRNVVDFDLLQQLDVSGKVLFYRI